ncbi:conserved hypothetical protein [Planktothrix serta PCC 8927]|uniref:Uncharacterized protein n=1 Tax=Planktothrix serta PCC 8927 TaxID=671068 RepID=A0A7Z9E5A5_9CYAN|nr:hypothetical protein [Planktothrix serta]VXD25852.1 conserved hypothetical protein [Planktothrix serta PCC 8927]
MSSLITLLLIAIYGGGIWKFWRGFENTNFNRSFQNRLILSLLWPVLVFNSSYRKNFTKALKGSK